MYVPFHGVPVSLSSGKAHGSNSSGSVAMSTCKWGENKTGYIKLCSKQS